MTAVDGGRQPVLAAAGALARKMLCLPAYPVLIAAYFPMHLMSENLALFRVEQVVRPVAVSVLSAVLALILLNAITRKPHRAALWVALGLTITVFFIPLQDLLDTTTRVILGISYSGDRLIALAVLAAAVGALVRPGRRFTEFANVMAAVMLLIPTLTIARAAVAMSQARAAIEAEAERQHQTLFGAVPGGGPKPSIVHIVLDGYARQDVLREIYGFDNAAFLNQLRDRGFAIADEATTPYTQTLLVLNSVFSARYIQEMLPDRPSDEAAFRQMLSARLQINDVMRTLSELDYQTASADVEYDPVRMDRVDRFFPIRGFALTNFEKAAYGQTAIVHLWRRIGAIGTGDGIRRTFAQPHHRSLDAPFFLLLHILAPHPPFDVDRHGNPIDVSAQEGIADGSPLIKESPALRRLYRNGYVEKLRFVNAEVLAYVDRLLTEVPGPKVVVLHGDHGGGMLLDHNDPAASCLKERFSPLVAVYASDGRLPEALPDDLNLVNLYRVIFNEVFGATLPLLPDRHFFARWSRPDRFEPLSPAQLEQPCDSTAPWPDDETHRVR